MTRRARILGGALLVVIAAVATLAICLSHNSPCLAAPPLPAGAHAMQAAVHRCYGPPEVVKLESIAKPVPGEHQVLIRVHAASVNPFDWHMLRGDPFLMRMQSGWGAPEDTRLGVDFAGTVEAVGSSVTRFKPGDPIFGGANGSFAEYVTARGAGSLELMPSNLTFEQAAAVPVAGLTALQALRDYGKVQPGQRVLVNGAAGGVGTFAVQIAKAFGADVTAVTSTASLVLVRSIGADHVIDYTREDFTRGTQRYDVIVDCGGGHSILDFRRALTRKGIYVLVGEAHMGQWLEPFANLFIVPPLLSSVVSQQFVSFIATMRQADLGTLRELIQSGKVRPVIDRRYPLSRMTEAIRYLETGHAHGKVVISLD
jgi:NADPH:quinone reductase-like Zn-dependent oxidoreductase